ncbi:MAG: hypothetical protein AB7I34_22115 [Rhizobiaceae bacterium]
MPGDKWPRHDPQVTAGAKLGLAALVVVVVVVLVMLPFALLVRG